MDLILSCAVSAVFENNRTYSTFGKYTLKKLII